MNSFLRLLRHPFFTFVVLTAFAAPALRSQASPPAVIGVTPNSGSGSAQTFSFQYSSVNGSGYLQYMYQIVNTSTGFASSCTTLYANDGSNSVYLAQDNGSSWLGPAVLGSATTLQNSQCTVNVGQSSASGSGNVLTLSLALSFKPNFVGTQNLYGFAIDKAGNNSGSYQHVGTWTVTAPTSAPAVLGVTPSSGSGSTQTFRFQYSSVNGSGYLQYMYQIVNTSTGFANSCTTLYANDGSNSIYLAQDNGSSWLGPAVLGSATTLQNSQCTVNVGQSSASGSGNALTLSLALSFKPNFVGTQNLYGFAIDKAANNSGSYQHVGTWTVTPPSAPAVLGVTPSSGSGSTQTFSFQYSSVNGSNYLQYMYQIVNTSTGFASSCTTLYANDGSNSVYLAQDNGSSWLGPAVLGSATTLQNSQCTVNVGQSSASGSGNVLTLSLALSFKPNFVGTQNLYGFTIDKASNNSGSYQRVGTWTVTASSQIPTAINHVIFMMQENRSFDNYFGMLNPYRKQYGYAVGDDGKEYDVDGLDGSKANIANFADPGTGPNGTTPSFSPFKLQTTCTADMSSAWLESFGDVNKYDFSLSRSINMDGFVHNAENYSNIYGDYGQRAMGYFDQGFLNYYYFMASQFAVSDRWFSPVASKTIPNRVATMTGGTTQGLVRDPSNDDHLPQLSIKTIFEELDNAGVSWKIYYTNTDNGDPFPATTFGYFTYSGKYMYSGTCQAPTQNVNGACLDPNHIAPLSQYYTDVQNGTLPQFAYIEPGYNDNTDEHPDVDVAVGQQRVANIVNALMNSQSWKDSAFFLGYDEGGGPFDHVPPVPGHSNDKTDAALANITPDISSIAVNADGFFPCAPPTPPTATLHCDLQNYGGYQDPGWNSGDAASQQGFAAQLGFRVPNIVISPFTRRHYVSHIPMDHTAIIKFVENRFIGSSAHLTNRDAAQPNLLDFFDFNAMPWVTPPTPPTPSAGSCNPRNL